MFVVLKSNDQLVAEPPPTTAVMSASTARMIDTVFLVAIRLLYTVVEQKIF